MPTCPTCNGRFEQATFCPKDGTALIPDGEPVKSLVGQVIGRYRLIKLLGAGGMGEVYVGDHVSITKKVAVKLLHPEISTNREAVIRFEQEAKSASSIGHDNIVRIDDFDRTADGRVYLCMEFLQGESLSEAMAARGGIDPMRALVVMIQVCNGLGAAHAKGIIHRDMKPENVFLVRRSDGGEVAKILDFGIAKVKGTDNNDSLTKTGTVFGTPHYMSPEQALGQKLDHRADIYSVGVMLFEIFTGQVPFKAESFMGILSQHITKPAPRPSSMAAGRTIPKPIEDIILKAMAKEADGRFSTMSELGTALKAVLDDAVRSGVPLPAGVGASVNAGLALPTAVDGVAPAPDALPTMASRPIAQAAAAGYQPTMASVSPQQGQMAPPYQPTMASAPGAVVAGGVAAAAPGAPPPLAPSGTSEVIPKTMFATGSGAAATAAGAGVPTPMPMPTPIKSTKKKSNTGLIIGIVGGVVLLLGGGAVAAVVFWDKIVGDDSGGTAAVKSGSGSGTGSAAAGTGTGTGAVAPAKPDMTKVAVADPAKDGGQVEPKVEPKDEPKVEPKDEPKVEPKDEPKVEPKDEPKIEPKGIAKKKKGEKKAVEAKVEAKVEPKVIAKKKVEPKVVEECCKIRVDSIPSDAAVIINGRPSGARTPWVKKFDRNERVSVTFAKGGYLDTAVSFTANENGTKKFKLKRRNLLGIPEGNPGAPGSDPFR
jgi:serine/threonine-protein kinase